ncbi:MULTISPECIES: DUF6480 family protein [Streptomyces]|uniref:DUF6480 family protein n=1 Tax=Streptomyces sudanensis TaxID=436397 RepID=A0ABY4THM5_9ACTN|nr:MULTISPECIES: DUF6480 family protein [Streptomyces]MCP9960083.1 DUF6480 family protein [Streptomyces sudanensis]MCP9989089.1 DUF6480 family protein [Streptomyces sudanensis]URN18405.1 DUF6480 family protein [Streptomyces sudanensis]
MTHHINPPDPDPDRTPGLDAGASVRPGDTPPAEGSTSGAGPQETHNPPTGWAKAPLAIILVLTALIAAFFIVRAVSVTN